MEAGSAPQHNSGIQSESHPKHTVSNILLMVIISKQWGKTETKFNTSILHLEDYVHIIFTYLNGKNLVTWSQVAMREYGNYGY